MKSNQIFSELVRGRRMIARFFKQLPAEAAKTGVVLAVAGIAGMQIFPVLREWDFFAAFPSKAYMEREVCLSITNNLHYSLLSR